MNIAECYPKYSEFKKFHNDSRIRRKKDEAPACRTIAYYILAVIGISIFIAGLSLFFLRAGGRSSRRNYPSGKYRKVVKEGLLWDSVEWHER